MKNDFFFVNGDEEMILDSSTPGSEKKFRVTCDDNGTLTVTNVETGETGETTPVDKGWSGGGATTAILEYDESVSGLKCTNMTYEDAVQVMQSTGRLEALDVSPGMYCSRSVTTDYFPDYPEYIAFFFVYSADSSETMYWTQNSITNTKPEGVS